MYSAAVDENLRLPSSGGGGAADQCCCRTELDLLLVKTFHVRVVLLELLFCGCHCQSQNQAFILKNQDQSPEQPTGVALLCLDQKTWTFVFSQTDEIFRGHVTTDMI